MANMPILENYFLQERGPRNQGLIEFRHSPKEMFAIRGRKGLVGLSNSWGLLHF